MIRPPEINVLAIVKLDGERWVLLYTDDQAAEALRNLGRWAGNSDLSFTWYDAAVLSQRIRERSAEAAAEKAHAPRF